MPSKLLRVKVAAVAGLAIASIGGVAAAATGLVPVRAERTVTQAAGTPGVPVEAAAHVQGVAAAMVDDPRAAVATRGSGSGKPADHAAGPEWSGAARHGRCQAWLAGQGDVHGRRTDARAFQALAAAAGGASQVPAYCQADPGTSAKGGRQPAAPAGSAPSKTSPPTTGQRENPGQGQGGPATTT